MRLVLAGLVALGCGAPPPAAAPRAAAPQTPQLVLVVVLDQLPVDALERHRELLDPEGLLRNAAARYRVRLAHAGTNTAPGHASIQTGVPAAVHGVMANDRWSAAAGDDVPVVDDGAHRIFGRDGAHASPAILEVPTVGDQLRAVTGGAARVVAVSMKARAAILSAGRRPTAAIWYDKKVRGFTTSSYYASELPPWVAAFNRDHPIDEALAVWRPLFAGRYQRQLGGDGAPGEGDWNGLGTTFPHDPRRSSEPEKVFLASPHSSAWLFELAGAAIERYRLGADDTPDLLTISVSATDYAGHTFGPRSWEYADNLIRADRLVTALFAELEAAGVRVAVLITSDHGGAPLPERAGGGGRLVPAEFAAELNGALDRALGDGDWVLAYVQPFITLSAAARARRAEVIEAVAAAVAADERIHRIVDVTGLDRLGPSPLDASIRASIGADPPGDLFVVPAAGYVLDPKKDPGRGTGHGTPWDADAIVPVLVDGPGVEPEVSVQVADHGRVAATIAALLGIEPPAQVTGPPL